MKEYVELEKADVDAMASRDAEAQARLSALEGQFDTFKASVLTAQAAVESKVTALQKDMAAMDVRMKAVEQWWTTVDKGLFGLDQRLKKVEPELVSLDARLDKAEPVLVLLNQRLDANDAKDKGQDATDVNLDARADVLEAWKPEIAKTLALYETRLTKLEKPPVVVTPPVQS